MKVGIIGRGAIGSLYGMQFYQALKEDFCFIVDAQRKKQYTSQPFLCNGKEVHFPYQVEAKEPLDVLFIATKFGGFSQAIEQIRPFVGENTILCSCLNGISSEDLLQEAYPENTIVRTIVQGMDSTYLNQSVTYHLLGEIVFGAQKEKEEKACDQLEALFQQVKVPYRRVTDIVRQQWNKLMFNCGLNQVCAAFYTTYGGLQVPGPLQDLFFAAMKEVQMVARKKSIVLTDEDVQAWFDVLKPMSSEGMPSMRQDILSKRKTELALFSGTVVPLAKQLDIKTPVLIDLAKRIEAIESVLE